MRYCVLSILLLGVLALTFAWCAQAQDPSPAPPESSSAPAAPPLPLPVPQSAAGSMAGEPVTVLLMLQWGGVILWITMA
ncbi:MAG TPA: hypothetical protein PLI07_14735, partial [Candidatus Hydrogenedentes bacterium]|nr:hypothetical protein [Candidatus Hydrogenedentota bacterium]